MLAITVYQGQHVISHATDPLHKETLEENEPGVNIPTSGRNDLTPPPPPPEE